MANQDFLIRDDFVLRESLHPTSITWRLRDDIPLTENIGAYTTGYENSLIPPFHARPARFTSRVSHQLHETTAEPPP